MDLKVNQNLVDDVCNFFQISGWSFGWCLVMEDGEEFWQADTFRGDIRLVARDKVLGLALLKLKFSIFRMN